MALKSLRESNSGEKYKIQSISAGNNVTRRLYEMGLNTGAKIEVVKNDVGPIIVSLYGNKIALGREIADKIIVAV